MKRLFFLFLIVALLFTLISPISIVQAVSTRPALTAAEKASELLQKLSPEERVGQLFMVSFTGMDVGTTSQLYDLVVNRHIGGVVLKQENDNFSGLDDLLGGTQTLIKNLQSDAWPTSEGSTTDSSSNATYIPLFIAATQEGTSLTDDQILKGMTPLPDEMAIAATWNTANAEETGKILGKELRAIGFNLFLGPSLDVLDSVRTVDSEDLGVRTFGGDPYWVAEMGKAYIRGVHEGSENQVVVIAKNFPGRGSADRSAEDEVATVRKSLEQLKQIELAPFFAVTGNTSDPLERADGLLVSHIRYQGFQGNIRATTRPVSLDSTALEQILALPQFTDWRNSGGIMVSDDLGAPSIRKFFDPTGTAFDARQVAKNAFLAGNDLLYLGNLISTGDSDNYTTITRIIDQFLQKYLEDPAFSSKVDDAVLRLLTLKFQTYADFNPVVVSPGQDSLSVVGTDQKITFQIASDGVTLISPDSSEIDSVLPDAPQITDRIVFISDSYSEKQCSTCANEEVFSPQGLRDAVIRLYGPTASEQVQGYRLSSYSFDDLKNLLDQTGDVIQLQDDLASADWIVLSFLGENQTAIGQKVLRQFLSEKVDLIKNKRIIGFAFNAPYYLDATDISKLTAYYCVYSKSSPFIDVAARVLFRELIPPGSLPVSVAGVGYDLITATTPDPTQIIQLIVDLPDQTVSGSATSTASLEPTAVTVYNVGDTLPIRTGVIVDHNGHPVPNGTVVRFMIDTGSGSGSVETVETVTENGIARTTYRIPSTGSLELSVQAEPALISQTLRLDITESGGVLTAIEPTIFPTEISSATAGSPAPTEGETSKRNSHPDGLPTPGDWLLSTILILGISVALYWLGSIRANIKWGLRWGGLACLGGYLAYLYLALGLPGTSNFINLGGSVAVGLTCVVGVILGWAAAGIWWWRATQMKENARVNVTK